MLPTTTTTTTKCCIILLVNLIACIEASKLGGYSLGTFNAGIIGTYAGQLSGGEALKNLQQSESYGQVEEEQHDFSDSDGNYENLHQLGDNLNEEHFPADIDAEQYQGYDVQEYGAEEKAAASEQHDQIEVHGSLEALSLIKQNNFDDDYHEKPVIGIDHGDGAYSYSTTYGEQKSESELND